MKKTYFLAGVSILFWSSLATISKLLLGTMNSYQMLTLFGSGTKKLYSYYDGALSRTFDVEF